LRDKNKNCGRDACKDFYLAFYLASCLFCHFLKNSSHGRSWTRRTRWWSRRSRWIWEQWKSYSDGPDICRYPEHVEGRNGVVSSTPPQSVLLYPFSIALVQPMRPPVLSEYSDKEKRIAASQIGFATRMKRSAYYIVEQEKSTELPRYSDKYRPSSASQPKLQRTDLHAPFFPPEIFDAHFNPKKKPKSNFIILNHWQC